jgi:membrane-associated protease RseP (regulator of RpoE activity)
MRPYFHLGVAALAGAMLAVTLPGADAQSSRISQIITEPNPLAVHSGAQGYLGVLVSDVDSESASRLKLKEARGALITLIDHDAPAAQAGLRVNDVVLEMNGQAVEGAEQFGRMMREVPAGHKVSLVISRDGAAQTIGVQLADRKKMETEVWNRLGSNTDVPSPTPGMGILGSNGSGSDAPATGGFHMPFIGSSSLNVGALVEPLTSQMADYLGVSNGLMVKQVARKSEAAAAGFKAFDVILKVGVDTISTVSDWDRALRANLGKPVQVTVLREKKQQTLTLQVDSKRKSSLEFNGLLPDGPCPMMALADPAFAQDLARGLALNESDIQSMREQAEALRDQFETFKDEGGILKFKMDPEQVEEFRKQAEQFKDAFKDQDFHIDQKQIDQMKKQMEEFQKNFKADEFEIDEKQLDQLKNQMEQFRKAFPPNFDKKLREEMKQQMDQLKRQMEEERALGFGDHV